jgi:hypothetical protein
MVGGGTFRTADCLGDFSNARLARDVVVTAFSCNVEYLLLSVGERRGSGIPGDVVLTESVDRH